MIDIEIDFRRTWFEGRDLTIRVVGFGGSRYRTSIRAEGGHLKETISNSQDEAIQKLPSVIESYQGELVAGEARKQA